jgi:hypothetical protein
MPNMAREALAHIHLLAAASAHAHFALLHFVCARADFSAPHLHTGAPHLMATPGGTTLYNTAATAAAERLKKERTYRSKVRTVLLCGRKSLPA